MENSVLIGFEDNVIFIEKNGLYFPFTREHLKNIPQDINVDDINEVKWNVRGETSLVLKGGNVHSFGEEKYNDYVQPYVDLWYEEKERLEQEEQEEQEKYNKFENRQARALIQLNSDFETVKDRAHVKSSLGFEVDANQTANENVTGLLVTIGEGETVQFCDYYNEFHELNKSDLETLQSEIIKNAQSLYSQKWQYRTAIENCMDNETLDSTVESIEFTYMDFTPVEEA